MVITVPYTECGPTEESFDRASGVFQGTRRFRVKWADRAQFRFDVLGLGSLLSLPDTFPGWPMAYARSCATQPEGSLIVSAAAATVAFEYAVATVQYAMQPGETKASNERTLIEESMEPSAQVLQLPHQDLYWDNAQAVPLEIEEAPYKICRYVDWNITLHGLDAVPATAITYMGCVNSVAVTSPTLGLTFAVETLLYHGGFPSRIITTAAASYKWKLAHKFTAKDASWNLFPRPGYPTFQVIYNSGGTAFKPYPPVAFDLSV